MADEPIDFEAAKRKLTPPSEFQKALAIIENIRDGHLASEDGQHAGEILRLIGVGEKSAEQRFELAMLKINLDPAVRRAIQDAYAALKTPDPEKAG